MMTTINPLAILVAAILYMALGAIWYSPVGFAKSWMKLTKKAESDIKKSMLPKIYALNFVIILITAYILTHVIIFMHARTIPGGMSVGLWIWVGFTAAPSLTAYLFEGRPKKLFFINYGYHLVAFMLMGALLAVWR